MKLSDKYRPTSVSDIVGQFSVVKIKKALAQPYSGCWCFVGHPGTGKTACAAAVASELECDSEMTGLFRITASDLGVDAARELFDRKLRLRPFNDSGWKCVIIEELELLSQQCQVFLKVALENLPPKTTVLATSNGFGKLQEALMERFTVLEFLSGQHFANQCVRKLKEIWACEVGSDPPADIAQWGWVGDRFSMRIAMQRLQSVVDGRPARCRVEG